MCKNIARKGDDKLSANISLSAGDFGQSRFLRFLVESFYVFFSTRLINISSFSPLAFTCSLGDGSGVESEVPHCQTDAHNLLDLLSLVALLFRIDLVI